MNYTAYRTRLLFLARELRTEAQHREPSPLRSELIVYANRLAKIARTAELHPPGVLAAFIDSAENMIVTASSERIDWAVIA